MACEFCKNCKPLAECDKRLSLKGDFHPGIYVDVCEGMLYIEAVPDTYEPGYMEKYIDINYCPMCGQKFSDLTK